jgi:hypothetical protein
MELTADTNVDAREGESSVEGSEVKPELQVEQEESVVGEKLNWGLEQHAGGSRYTHRFTGHETGLRKSEALTKSHHCQVH